MESHKLITLHTEYSPLAADGHEAHRLTTSLSLTTVRRASYSSPFSSPCQVTLIPTVQPFCLASLDSCLSARKSGYMNQRVMWKVIASRTNRAEIYAYTK